MCGGKRCGTCGALALVDGAIRGHGNKSFQAWVCLDEYGQVEAMDARLKPVRFLKGDTLFLLVGIGRCLVIGDTMILKIRC